jgi:hypothetical protein
VTAGHNFYIMARKNGKTAVGRILQSIGRTIAKLFGTLDETTKILVRVSKEVVNNMKLIDETHVGDILTALIPGNVDDKIYAKLKDLIPKALDAIALAEEFANIADPNEKMRAILLKINSSTSEGKKIFYTGLAALFLELTADGDLSWADSGKLTGYYYENEHLLKQAA